MPKVLKFFLIFMLFCSVPLSAQLYTREAHQIREDRFRLLMMMSQFEGATNERVVRLYEFVPEVGLTRRVEFTGWLPFYRVKEFDDTKEQTLATMGDLIVDLKFQLGRGWYKIPFFQKKKDTRYYSDLYFGFNTGTGPEVNLYGGRFDPYAMGLGDFRWGVLLGSYTKKVEVHANILYTYASYFGENFFPLEKDILRIPGFGVSTNEENTVSTNDELVVFFNVHKVLLKFLWPGKIYGETPLWDDYISYNLCASYWFEMKPLLFKHELFLEVNGLQPFGPQYCLRKARLDLTAGLITRFFKGGKAVMAVTLPVLESDYRGAKVTAGLLFSL